MTRLNNFEELSKKVRRIALQRLAVQERENAVEAKARSRFPNHLFSRSVLKAVGPERTLSDVERPLAPHPVTARTAVKMQLRKMKLRDGKNRSLFEAQQRAISVLRKLAIKRLHETRSV